MTTTLTVRTGQALRAAMEQRAKAEGKTVSAIGRDILEDVLKVLAARSG